MTLEVVLLIISASLALGLGWAIGANDAANALGPAFGAGILSAQRGVLIASVGEFAGAASLGSSVAATLATKVLVRSTIQGGSAPSYDLGNHSFAIASDLEGDDRWAATNCAALAGAAIFLAIATKAGMPASSTHSAIAALVGTGLAASALGMVLPLASVQWGQIRRIVASWVLSPCLGSLIAMLTHLLLLLAVHKDAMNVSSGGGLVAGARIVGPLATSAVVFVSVALIMGMFHQRWENDVSKEGVILYASASGILSGLVSASAMVSNPLAVASLSHRLHRWSLGNSSSEREMRHLASSTREALEQRLLADVPSVPKSISAPAILGPEEMCPSGSGGKEKSPRIIAASRAAPSQETIVELTSMGGHSASGSGGAYLHNGMPHDCMLASQDAMELGSSSNPAMGVELSDAEAALVGPILMLALLMCVAHGSNDVANALGPLVAVLKAYDHSNEHEQQQNTNEGGPWWTAALVGAGIIGGVMVQGYRVMETVGSKIARLNVRSSFSCQLSTVSTVLLASGLGLPISTTHVLIGAVCGVAGADSLASRFSCLSSVAHGRSSDEGEEVHHEDSSPAGGLSTGGVSTLFRIASCWVLTLPAAAALAAIAFSLTAPLFALIH